VFDCLAGDFVGGGLAGGRGGLRGVGLLSCGGLATVRVLAHFLEFLGADAFDG